MTLPLLTPRDVHERTFGTHRLREGYDTTEVDEFLDQCEDTISRLANTIKELEKEEVK